MKYLCIPMELQETETVVLVFGAEPEYVAAVATEADDTVELVELAEFVEMDLASPD